MYPNLAADATLIENVIHFQKTVSFLLTMINKEMRSKRRYHEGQHQRLKQ